MEQENTKTVATSELSNGLVCKPLTLKQTCSACPAQWEGKLPDGRMFYIRYRGGYFSFRISEQPTDDVMDAVSGVELFAEQRGNWLDGYMDENEMKDFTKKNIDWSGLSTQQRK